MYAAAIISISVAHTFDSRTASNLVPRPGFPTAAVDYITVSSCWESGSGDETRLHPHSLQIFIHASGSIQGGLPRQSTSGPACMILNGEASNGVKGGWGGGGGGGGRPIPHRH